MKPRTIILVSVTDELQMITVESNSSVTPYKPSGINGLDGANFLSVTDVTVTSYSFNSRPYKICIIYIL